MEDGRWHRAPSYFLNKQDWMCSNMARSCFSTSASGTVTFAPVSLLTATHWRCCKSLGPTSRRIGTPCMKVKHWFVFLILLSVISKVEWRRRDLELPVVELPPWGVVVSEVALHPDACSLQDVLVLGALGQESLLVLLWQGSGDTTGDDDNLLKQTHLLSFPNDKVIITLG